MMHLLLVDDAQPLAEQIARVIAARFNAEGIQCRCDYSLSIQAAVDFLRHQPGCNLVLLDIKGVCDNRPGGMAEAMERIRHVAPGIPVIALSELEDTQFVMEMWDSGASGYLFKANLHLGQEARLPQDTLRYAADWDILKRRIRTAIARYEPVRRRLQDPQISGAITKYGDRDSIIVQQRTFLERVAAIPQLRDHFPPVTDYGRKGSGSYYVMPHYRMPTLRSRLFETTDSDDALDLASRVLSKVWNFVFGSLYRVEKVVLPPPNYVQAAFFDRFDGRLARALDLLHARKDFISPSVKSLMLADELVVGGMPLAGPSKLLEELRQDDDLRRRLVPPTLGMIHGDLHFSNILAPVFDESEAFKLIDPRGGGASDPAYDVGKLLHSAEGKYDFIHKEYLRLDPSSIEADGRTTKCGELCFSPWHTRDDEEGGGSGAGLVATIMGVPEGHLEVFNRITEWIVERGRADALFANDPDWLLRARLHEALHFCTMVPFHLTRPSVAGALWVRGAELLNRFHSDYVRGE